MTLIERVQMDRFFVFFFVRNYKNKNPTFGINSNHAPKRCYNSNLLFQGLLGRYALSLHERTWRYWWWTPLQSKSLDLWIACLSLYINTPNFSSLMMWDSQHSNVELYKGFYFSSSPSMKLTGSAHIRTCLIRNNCPAQ